MDNKPEDTLTPREFQVLELLVQGRGLRNQDIAHELGVSEDNIKKHVCGAMRKTGSDNRIALAMWFMERFPDEKSRRRGLWAAFEHATTKPRRRGALRVVRGRIHNG